MTSYAMKTPEQQLVMTILTLNRISQERKLELLTIIAQEGISNRVKSLCQLLAIPSPLVRDENDYGDYFYSTSASQIFNYLPPATRVCGHFTISSTDGETVKPYTILYIATREHLATPDCVPLSLTKAKQIAHRFAAKEAFSILLNGYAIRAIQIYRYAVIAQAYGHDRTFLLRKSEQ